MEIAYSLAVALFLTIALMPIAIRLAPRFGLIDKPDHGRKQHLRIVPRCGGIAMAIGIAVPVCVFASRFFEAQIPMLISLLAGAAIIVAFGLLDDSQDLDYRWKFAGQIIATLIVVCAGISFRETPLLGNSTALPYLNYIVSFLFVIGVTNAVNLSDGLDGLAGGSSLLTLSVIALISLLAHEMFIALIAITAVGGVLGFLRFNTHPAQVFMGDAGSQLLGFLSACLSILIAQSGSAALSPALPLLLLGLPILDTLTVMVIRISQRRSPFSPDRNHLHHQIVALGFRHHEAVAIIYMLQLLLLATAFLLRHAPDWQIVLAYLLFCASLVLLLRAAVRHQWRPRLQQPAVDLLDRRNPLLRRLGWFYRNAACAIQIMVGIALLAPLVRIDRLQIASTAVALLMLLVVAPLAVRSRSPWLLRAFIYPASAVSAYLLATDHLLQSHALGINLFFITLAAVLALAVRMTRREDFSLNTQDILVLIIILTAPLLPFEAFNRYAIGDFVLKFSVLMYSGEFLIGRTQDRRIAPLASIASLSLVIGFFAL